MPPRRTDNRIIEELREAMAAGVPWITGKLPERGPRGYADLIFLVEGLYYPICDFIRGKDDIENIIAIWGEIREDCLREHIARRPGTRPAAWWKYEDRDRRRVDEIEEEYLERLGLLRKKEREALRESDTDEPSYPSS